jgi:hypothetical protein
MNPIPSLPAAEPGTVRLEDFFERVRTANPFTDNRVTGPAPTGVDVANIHEAAFARLTGLAAEAHDTRRGLGAVLWGEAGIGKSHLLSRLAHWAEQDQHACFVYIHNLQASPANLPRSLLKCVVSHLTGGQVRQFYGTTLYRLVRETVKEALRHDPARTYSWGDAQRAYDNLVDQLSAPGSSRLPLVDRTAYDVLLTFFRSAYFDRDGPDDRLAAGAVRWLAGDYLDPEEARQLGLPPGRAPGEPVALADNQQIKQVLVALSQLALYRRQPFLLCFDQVDNLDTEQAAALARFLEALIDSAANLFVVTAGIQASLLDWRRAKVIQDSAWDRLAQFEVGLQRISVAEACRILAVRIERFLEPYLELDAVRQHIHEDHLFPLGRAWVDDCLKGAIDFRPREAINKAREGWRREQEALQQLGGPRWLAGWGRPAAPPVRVPVAPPTAQEVQSAIDRKVAEKMAEHKAQRLANRHTLPPDADHLSGLAAALLEQCRQIGTTYGLVEVERLAPTKRGHKPPYDLLVRQYRGHKGKKARTGLLFLATGSAQSATLALRRLVQETKPAEHLRLITEERQPLPLASKGQEYLDQLRRRGTARFRHLELTFEAYAGLDALQAVVGLARSGDLEVEPVPGQVRRVSEREVIESHHRQGRYWAAPLLRDLLGEDKTAAKPHEQDLPVQT